MVINEGISGVGGCVRFQSSYAAVHIYTEGHVEVLLDDSFNIDGVSQEILVAWPLILPVVCTMI